MQIRKESGTANPAGSFRIVEAAPTESYKRADFFRDLKKVAKKQDRPSRPDR
jgi:hypothetical protein